MGERRSLPSGPEGMGNAASEAVTVRLIDNPEIGEQPRMDVNIRGMDRAFWRQVCTAAASLGLTRKEAVVEALRLWLRTRRA